VFEEYYESLAESEVDEYLKRIGMERPKAPTKEYLDELVMKHQCAVPFENLDIYDLHKPISIIPKDIYDKVVGRKRGGYCFELNGLFVLLLKGLGFDAYSCPCRVARGDMTFPGPVRHRGNIVRMDGKYLFCDVGFGGAMPPGAVVIEDMTKQIVNGETYWFEQGKESWWMLRRLTKGKLDIGIAGAPVNEEIQEANVLMISTGLWEPVDYISANLACSEGPDATFAKTRMLNLRRTDGHIAVTGDKFTRVKDGVKETLDVTYEEAMRLAKDEFGLII
jgi:N-hydroxyarylamine O-acetyltransferase